MEFEIIGYDENNEPIYQELLTAEEIGERLKDTNEGRAFLAKYSLDDQHNVDLLHIMVDRLGDEYTLEQAQHLLKNIVYAGGIISVPEEVRVGNTTYVAGQHEFVRRPVASEPEPQPEPEIPAVDARGHLLGASQKRWSEYRQFSDTHSAQECRDRAKVDKGFASFVKKNLEREMTEGGVGDSVQNLNAHPEVPKTPSAELVAWVAEYHRTPNEQVRKLKRADFNPTGFESYNRNLQAAIDAGLI